jgi:hypothetical protein
VELEAEGGFKRLNRWLREFGRMKLHPCDAGQVDTHLIASKDVDGVNWHVFIPTLDLEF